MRFNNSIQFKEFKSKSLAKQNQMINLYPKFSTQNIENIFFQEIYNFFRKTSLDRYPKRLVEETDKEKEN